MQCQVSDFMLFDLSAVFDTVKLFFCIGILSVLALGHPSHFLMSLATSVSFSKFLKCPAWNISSLSELFQSWALKTSIYWQCLLFFFNTYIVISSPNLSPLPDLCRLTSYLTSSFEYVIGMSNSTCPKQLICTPPTNLFPWQSPLFQFHLMTLSFFFTYHI